MTTHLTISMDLSKVVTKLWKEIPFDQTIDNKSMDLMFEVSAFILPECIRKMKLKAEI